MHLTTLATLYTWHALLYFSLLYLIDMLPFNEQIEFRDSKNINRGAKACAFTTIKRSDV